MDFLIQSGKLFPHFMEVYQGSFALFLVVIQIQIKIFELDQFFYKDTTQKVFSGFSRNLVYSFIMSADSN